MENITAKKNGRIFNKIVNFISNLFEEKEDDNIYHAFMHIPADVLYRTELMCDYVCAQENEEDLIDVGDVIKILYAKFIREAIEEYAPHEIFEMLSTKYTNDDKIVLSDGMEQCNISRKKGKMYSVEIGLPYDDVRCGNLVLKEIYELFKCKFSFDKLLEQIWLKFIYDYRTGKNKEAMKCLKAEMIEYLVRNYPDEELE